MTLHEPIIGQQLVQQLMEDVVTKSSLVQLQDRLGVTVTLIRLYQVVSLSGVHPQRHCITGASVYMERVEYTVWAIGVLYRASIWSSLQAFSVVPWSLF